MVVAAAATAAVALRRAALSKCLRLPAGTRLQAVGAAETDMRRTPIARGRDRELQRVATARRGGGVDWRLGLGDGAVLIECAVCRILDAEAAPTRLSQLPGSPSKGAPRPESDDIKYKYKQGNRVLHYDVGGDLAPGAGPLSRPLRRRAFLVLGAEAGRSRAGATGAFLFVLYVCLLL